MKTVTVSFTDDKNLSSIIVGNTVQVNGIPGIVTAKTPLAPPAPALISPVPNETVTGNSVEFRWAPSSGATSYWLSIIRNADNFVLYNRSVGNVQAATAVGFLNDGARYRWAVAAGNADGWTASLWQNFNNGIIPIPTGKFYCDSVTLEQGSIIAGNHLSLHGLGDYLTIQAATQNRELWELKWTAEFSLGGSNVKKLTFFVTARYDTWRNQSLYLFNFQSGLWERADYRGLNMVDNSFSFSKTYPAAYISSQGKVKLRYYVYGSDSITGYYDSLMVQAE